MKKNSLGIEIPSHVDTIGKLSPYKGAWVKLSKGWMAEFTIPAPNKAKKPHVNKLCDSLYEAINKCEPHDGMTISFHHHLRGGDGVLVRSLDILAKMGIKDITLASSSLTAAHEPILKYIEDGTISMIFSSGIRGKLGEAIAKGALKNPVVIHSHGGRVRAVKTGRIRIDLTIIAAAASDQEGNATGAQGPSAFGSMGYAQIDAQYAKQVIVVTDNMVQFPCTPQSLTQQWVDYVVRVDSIGEASKIASGTTRITKSPMDLHIAQLAAKAIRKTAYFKEGISFQFGAGGASLAVAKFVRKEMKAAGIKGSFILGGVTSYCVEMLEEGLFRSIHDVQSFDSSVSSSLYNNPHHIEVTADLYANPFNAGSMTNKLDVVVLGALEVDTNFNVNVITGSSGFIRGASGGHSDTAAGASLTVIVCPSFRGRLPIVTRKVNNIVTPGESVDLVVTERGICVNPARPDLLESLENSGLHIVDIQDLAEEVHRITGEPAPIEYKDNIVGLIEYRDGTIIDVIKQVKE